MRLKSRQLTELKIIAIAANKFSSLSSGESASCNRVKYVLIVCRACSEGGVILDCNHK